MNAALDTAHLFLLLLTVLSVLCKKLSSGASQSGNRPFSFLGMALALALQEPLPKLSAVAKITLPEDPSFADVSARWSDYKAPQPGLVVTVASESDIEQTVSIHVTVALRRWLG